MATTDTSLNNDLVMILIGPVKLFPLTVFFSPSLSITDCWMFAPMESCHLAFFPCSMMFFA